MEWLKTKMFFSQVKAMSFPPPPPHHCYISIFSTTNPTPNPNPLIPPSVIKFSTHFHPSPFYLPPTPPTPHKKQ